MHFLRHQELFYIFLFSSVCIFSQRSVSVISEEKPSLQKNKYTNTTAQFTYINQAIMNLEFSLTLKNVYGKVLTEDITEHNCDIIYSYDGCNSEECLLYRIDLDKVFPRRFLDSGISFYCFKSNKRCFRKLEAKGTYITEQFFSDSTFIKISKNKNVRAMQNIPLKDKDISQINITIYRP